MHTFSEINSNYWVGGNSLTTINFTPRPSMNPQINKQHTSGPGEEDIGWPRSSAFTHIQVCHLNATPRIPNLIILNSWKVLYHNPLTWAVCFTSLLALWQRHGSDRIRVDNVPAISTFTVLAPIPKPWWPRGHGRPCWRRTFILDATNKMIIWDNESNYPLHIKSKSPET